MRFLSCEQVPTYIRPRCLPNNSQPRLLLVFAKAAVMIHNMKTDAEARRMALSCPAWSTSRQSLRAHLADWPDMFVLVM